MIRPQTPYPSFFTAAEVIAHKISSWIKVCGTKLRKKGVETDIMKSENGFRTTP